MVVWMKDLNLNLVLVLVTGWTSIVLVYKLGPNTGPYVPVCTNHYYLGFGYILLYLSAKSSFMWGCWSCFSKIYVVNPKFVPLGVITEEIFSLLIL